MEKILKRRLVLVTLTVSAVIYCIFAFALSPAIVIVNNDATIAIDYLPDILKVLQKVLDFSAFFICYGITVFGIYRFGLKGSLPIISVFAGMTVMKYALNIVSSRFIFDTAQPDLASDISSSAVNVAAELVQYFIIIAICQLIIGKYRKLAAISAKNAEKLDGFTFDPRDKVFPFQKLLSRRNPVQRANLLAAVTVSVILISERLIYDILLGGLPRDLTDAIWMIVYYGSDILFGVLGYFVMTTVEIKCDQTDVKLRQMQE